jgi:hypothetical protein
MEVWMHFKGMPPTNIGQNECASLKHTLALEINMRRMVKF